MHMCSLGLGEELQEIKPTNSFNLQENRETGMLKSGLYYKDTRVLLLYSFIMINCLFSEGLIMRKNDVLPNGFGLIIKQL